VGTEVDRDEKENCTARTERRAYSYAGMLNFLMMIPSFQIVLSNDGETEVDTDDVLLALGGHGVLELTL